MFSFFKLKISTRRFIFYFVLKKIKKKITFLFKIKLNLGKIKYSQFFSKTKITKKIFILNNYF
jgi:hypothetical protein